MTAGRRPDAPIRPRFPGALAGGVAALAGGAVAGWMQWGAPGLVSVGLGALVVVAPIVDRLTASRRSLTSGEIDYVRAVYESSVDYDRVRLTRDSVFALWAPRTIMNAVHLKSGWGHFVVSSTDLSTPGLETLVHELGHVWQYQNGGLAYIPRSLWAQLRAWVIRGDRDEAYRWRGAADGIPWERWNPEQQARALEDYNVALRRTRTPGATQADRETVSLLEDVVRKVQRREGAPTFGLRASGTR